MALFGGTASALLNDYISATDSTWVYWNGSTVTTAASTTSTWRYWNNNSTTTSSIILPRDGVWVNTKTEQIQRPAPPILTPEQVAAEKLRREQMERKWAAERAAEQRAKDVAQELLVAHLTPEQRKFMADHKFFVVEGGKSKKKYRIWTEKGIHGNVEELDAAGKAIASYCVQLRDTYIPTGDHLLAQKLMFEHAEDDILKVANRTARRAA